MKIQGGQLYEQIGIPGETSRWEFFVGRNKIISYEFYTGVGRKGSVNTDPWTIYYSHNGSNEEGGLLKSYDPTNGFVIIDAMWLRNGHTSRRYAAIVTPAAGGKIDADGIHTVYFDIRVVEP